MSAQIAATDTDLRVVRSLCAEAALLIRLERNHRISATYARQMRKMAQDKLRSEAQSAEGEAGGLARKASEALAARDEPALLRLHAEAGGRLGP